MKEIYLLNKGDSVRKAQYEYNIENIEIKNNTTFNFRFVEIENGMDDIVIVKNYLPIYEYIIKDNETYLDILSRGFNTEMVSNLQSGDTIILNKPKSIRYVVKPLEKLEDIAQNFGVDIKYIIDVNNLLTDKLFVGQILWI